MALPRPFVPLRDAVIAERAENIQRNEHLGAQVDDVQTKLNKMTMVALHSMIAYELGVKQKLVDEAKSISSRPETLSGH